MKGKFLRMQLKVYLFFFFKWETWFFTLNFHVYIFFSHYSVCSRWNRVTRSPTLWKKVDVKFYLSRKSLNTMTMCFVNKLPSCVTSIRLDYSNLDSTEELNFEEFCVRLRKRCPHLEMLILEHVHFPDNLPSVIGLCTQFLPDLKILVFRHSTFSNCSTREKFGDISKIEVLDVSDCEVGRFKKIQFSNMPQLRVLNLRNSGFVSPAFLSLQEHGLNLEELYLCNTVVYPEDLIFSNSMFPRLKIICLCSNFSTVKGIFSAIQSCQSLQKLYIHECYLGMNIMSHPFFKDNRSKFTIIEPVAQHHNHNVDYSVKTNKI